MWRPWCKPCTRTRGACVPDRVAQFPSTFWAEEGLVKPDLCTKILLHRKSFCSRTDVRYKTNSDCKVLIYMDFGFC